MPKIEKFSAVGMFDPPTYSQGIKVSEAQTVLFLAGQVAYDKDGSVKHPGDFKAQAREVFRADKEALEAQLGQLVQLRRDVEALTKVRQDLEGRVGVGADELDPRRRMVRVQGQVSCARFPHRYQGHGQLR